MATYTIDNIKLPNGDICKIQQDFTPISWSDYENLPSDKKNSDTPFFIDDAPVSEASVLDTASGSIATFDDGSANPIKELTAQIVAVQSGSGEPSPSNVRPISGWDGANVNVSGANLWDEEWELGNISTTNGSNIDASNKIRSKNSIKVKPSTSYANVGYALTVYEYDKDNAFISSSTKQVGSFTVGDNTYYIRFSRTATTYNNDISINYPSTDTTYHAHNTNSHTYPISWQTQSGTVYGGNFKLFKDGGKWYCTVTADKVKYTPTTSDTLGGYVHTSNNGWAFTLNNSPSLKVGGDVISNINVPTAYTVTTNDGFCKVAVNKVIFFLSDSNNNLSADSSNSDIKNAFDTFVTNYSPQAVYELPTPETYTFEISTEIATLLGNNNIFADCGDIENCTYIKNTSPQIRVNDKAYTLGYYSVQAENANTVDGHTVAKDVPSNAVFTDTTYTANTTSIGSASGWSAGTKPSLSYTSRSIPNVTAANTPTTAVISGGTLTFTAGTALTLGTAISADDITSWSAGTLPSLTVTSTTVATGITAT